jgi:hypothetical protein
MWISAAGLAQQFPANGLLNGQYATTARSPLRGSRPFRCLHSGNSFGANPFLIGLAVVIWTFAVWALTGVRLVRRPRSRGRAPSGAPRPSAPHETTGRVPGTAIAPTIVPSAKEASAVTDCRSGGNVSGDSKTWEDAADARRPGTTWTPRPCERCGHDESRHYGQEPRGGYFCAALDCRCGGFRAVQATPDIGHQMAVRAKDTAHCRKTGNDDPRKEDKAPILYYGPSVRLLRHRYYGHDGREYACETSMPAAFCACGRYLVEYLQPDR